MKNLISRLIIFCVAFLFSGIVNAQSNQWKAVSPNDSLQIILKLNNGNLFYTVISANDEVVKPSHIGLKTTQGVFDGNLSFINTTSKQIEENYTLLIGKQKENHATGNETTVSFKNTNNNTITIELRAFNDGVAFRYRVEGSNKPVVVNAEATQFALPQGSAWIQNYDLSYESPYENNIPIGTSAKDSSGWAFPALFHANNHWLLITEANLDGSYPATHLQQNCDSGIYKIAFPLSTEAKGLGSIYPTTKLPLATPWRVIITGKNLGTIVESNLVYTLSPANKLGDVSWVKPGRSSWSWWSDHPSSRDYNTLKKYIDLSKDMGWEYSLVDANWNIMHGGDIQQLARYANTQNIGLTLWYNSGGKHNDVTEQPRNIMSNAAKRKAEFAKLESWGVKAVKVDFFDSDKQFIIQQYLDILNDAAKAHIMVIFHGCTLPRGWSRTYPNLLAMEGIRGAEQIGWDTAFATHAPMFNTINVFTRNVVGSMDYTPVTFSNTECCPHTTTNAHELALSVVYESGMLHFADSDSSYRSQNREVKNFLSNVPNTWDETKFIQGEPGKDVILARRSGTAWYVAGINGEDMAKDFSFTLPFNAKGYRVETFADGRDAHDIGVNQSTIESDAKMEIDVMPKGGFTMVLTPAK